MRMAKNNRIAGAFQRYSDAAENVELWKERLELDKASVVHEYTTSPLVYSEDRAALIEDELLKIDDAPLRNAEDRERRAMRDLRAALVRLGVPPTELDSDAIRVAVGTTKHAIFPSDFEDLSVADFSAFARAVARYARNKTKAGLSEVESEAKKLVEIACNAELEEWLNGPGKPDYEDVVEEALADGYEVEEAEA